MTRTVFNGYKYNEGKKTKEYKLFEYVPKEGKLTPREAHCMALITAVVVFLFIVFSY